MLATRYKHRRLAASALQHRWWRYLDINDYVVQAVDETPTTLWRIVPDKDGAIRKYRERLMELARLIRAEERGPSGKVKRHVDRMFRFHQDYKPRVKKEAKAASVNVSEAKPTTK